MGKKHIGIALTRLSEKHDSACDKIAQTLSAMSSLRMRKLEHDLSQPEKEAKKRTFSSNDDEQGQSGIVKLKCATLLLLNVCKILKILESGSDAVTKAKSWDYFELTDAYTKCISLINQHDQGGTGYYLRGSFWAFSSHDEREWTRTAWKEAEVMLRNGLAAARNMGPNGAELIAKWFCLPRPNLQPLHPQPLNFRRPSTLHQDTRGEVIRVLEAIERGCRKKLVSFSYLGPGAAVADGLEERVGEGNALTQVQLAMDKDSWASASNDSINLYSRFFNQEHTYIRMVVPHDLVGHKQFITRAGALIHELSHCHANTSDENISRQIFDHLDKPYKIVPAYAPNSCSLLARYTPGAALLNADNYRLFCEDAQLLGPW